RRSSDIITTKNSQADHQEIKHLRKSQRDHDEAYARGSQAHRTDKHGHHNADRYTNRKLNPAVRDAVMTEYADGIAAQANKHGVPETYQTGKAKHDIQCAGCQCINKHASEEGNVKRLIKRMSDKGQCSQQ